MDKNATRRLRVRANGSYGNGRPRTFVVQQFAPRPFQLPWQPTDGVDYPSFDAAVLAAEAMTAQS